MLNLTPFLIYVFVTIFTPGPNNVLSMTYGQRYGYRGTVKCIAGMMSGFLVLMLTAGLLNVALVNYVPKVRFWLNLLGAAYMVYLALHIVLSKPSSEGVRQKDFNSYRAGFLLQFANLKAILFGLTVFALFITPVYQNPIIVSLFALLMAGIGFVATSSWALGGNLFRNFLSKYERWFNLAMAALLIYTAAASFFAHPIT